ncbi:hypothetical protein BJ322DRAFT_1020315 [Thelephora terrestris]|uniref:Uncharacterized protein n=1 Tax=Thelephora terrestris TaxID=56493 RepID=A0A9P6HFU5_9AGAM|nr:hypothetical protein BJ322DRAFT_1020315 [Thelephora terrestris]
MSSLVRWEGGLVSKSTAANHRRDDLRLQTLDTFTKNVATHVLNHTPPAEPQAQHLPPPVSNDQSSHPFDFHAQAHLDDLYFMLEAETSHRCTWAPINHSLVFALSPSPTLQYRYPSTSEAGMPNRQPYALDLEKRENAAYLENEGRLCEILRVLKQHTVSHTRDCLLARNWSGIVKGMGQSLADMAIVLSIRACNYGDDRWHPEYLGGSTSPHQNY